jgi:cytochrome P450 family 3 subfamily A
MSCEELTAQCVFLIAGGYETTATAISYAIYNLARNPEAQDKLYEEAKTVFSSNVSSFINII